MNRRVPPDVRVGIVSWNTAELLERCLASLPAALDDLDAEIVVVDNASDDESVAVARRHPGVEVVPNTANVGYARGMNRALGATEAPVLIALNPDTDPPAGSLATLVRRLRARPEVGLVVPQLLNADGSVQHSVYPFPSLRSAAIDSFVPDRLRQRVARRWWYASASRAHPYDTAGPVDWAIGAVHVIKREALAGRPPYSERWFIYTEDIELCWRLESDGWSVCLEPDVRITHVGNASGAQAWGDVPRPRYLRGVYDFDARTHGRGHARAMAAINAAGACLHVAGNRLRGPAAGPEGDRRRRVAAELRHLLPIHASAVVRPEEGDRPFSRGRDAS